MFVECKSFYYAHCGAGSIRDSISRLENKLKLVLRDYVRKYNEPYGGVAKEEADLKPIKDFIADMCNAYHCLWLKEEGTGKVDIVEQKFKGVFEGLEIENAEIK